MKRNKIKIYLILTIVSLCTIVSIYIVLLKNNSIENNNIEARILAEKQSKLINIDVSVKQTTDDSYKCLLTFTSGDEENKIKSITYPEEEGKESYTMQVEDEGGRQIVALDYEVKKGDEDKTFQITTTKGDVVKERTGYKIYYHGNNDETVTATQSRLKGFNTTFDDADCIKEGYKLYGWSKLNNVLVSEYDLEYIYEENDSDIDLYSVWRKKNNDIVLGDSLLKAVNTINETIETNIKINEVEYSVDFMTINGDVVLDGETLIDAAVLRENVYEFGNRRTDVARETTDAPNMVAVKINGDLTINEGIELTSCKSHEGYGGTKGLVIYCTGKITNNGTMDMTGKGAKAVGQDVFLWKNQGGTYEYVPAEGAIGGASVYRGSNGTTGGNKGYDGTLRQTGGGGSGAARHHIDKSTSSGAGAKGSSYSGGTGGGSSDVRREYRSDAGAGADNGGIGGYGIATYSSGHGATGGTGNPGGVVYRYSGASGSNGSNGTGGLLIIYGNEIDNKGTICSEGVRANSNWASSGGSSGGGSVNIFYNTKWLNEGNVNANGGLGSESGYGGPGGNGTVTIGNISTGTFIKDE